MIIDHIWGVFTHPREEIISLRDKRLANTPLYIFYLLVLAAIPPISGFIGATQIGWRIGDGQLTKLTVESTIPLCVIAYFAILAGIVSVGLGVNWMRETYTDLTDKDMNGISFTAFIASPMLILSVVGMYPVIWVGMLTLIVAASYSVYLLYHLAPWVFRISQERSIMYAGSILTFALCISVVLIITTVIIWGMGFNPVFTN